MYKYWRKIIAGDATKRKQATESLASLAKVFSVLLAQITLKLGILMLINPDKRIVCYNGLSDIVNSKYYYDSKITGLCNLKRKRTANERASIAA